MAAVLTCECGSKPRYRLTIWEIGTMDDALGCIEVCDACMAGLELLQPRLTKIIEKKRRATNEQNPV